MDHENSLAELLSITLDLFPQDPVLSRRLEACSGESVVPGLLGCLYASVGHPNLLGARSYADAIEVRLRELGVLPSDTQ